MFSVGGRLGSTIRAPRRPDHCVLPDPPHTHDKALDAKYLAAKRTKEKLNQSMASFQQIKQAVEQDAGWRWAKADSEDAQAVLTRLEEDRARSPFWRMWFFWGGRGSGLGLKFP